MTYSSFYIFAFLLNFIATFAFIPNGREFHSSVLIDKKLYFSGGNNNSFGRITNEFFYLDVSKPFITTDDISIPWFDLTNTSGPSKLYATTCIGGKNNDLIFIFGYGDNQSFVNQFDTSKQQWIDFTPVGNVPADKLFISCANFNNGLIAIFSGKKYYPININDNDNNIWIFNTLTLTWGLSNATNAPPPRYLYCAITLPDENILYIGGINLINSSKISFTQMNSLSLYNTTSDMWANMSTSGQPPPARVYFSATLTLDGRIIIFGGGLTILDQNFNETFGDLWILDIAKYHWSIENILNPITDLALIGILRH
ncbi:hypothetical protein C2G38_2194250 [Gigaspora rosea]|uniref:Galactose oxidase n=1 Tax=Gigaspora rosea TaxID=44941 RepID=A0A397UX48_9GLOM|nr:hypothetical protein C2G38_2194250 [Gigaspora rosea]